MDEADDYVPQISQLDTSTGGYPFASDLSADSYVPPPTGPRPQQLQYMSPAQNYYQQQSQPMLPAQPPPVQTTPKGKGKKKKAQQQSLPAGPSFPSPQQPPPYPAVYQQQSPAQWSSPNYGQPMAGYMSQEGQNYAPRSPYQTPYGQSGYNQGMGAQNYYRHSVPTSYYQQQRQSYPNYQQQPAYYSQPQYPPRYPGQSVVYPGQPQYGQQRPMYPQQQQMTQGCPGMVAPQQRMYMPQQQMQSYPQNMQTDTQQVQPGLYGQQNWPQPNQVRPRTPLEGENQMQQPAPQQMPNQRPSAISSSVQDQELKYLEDQMRTLSQQTPTQPVQQQMQNVQQRLAYVRNQISASHAQYAASAAQPPPGQVPPQFSPEQVAQLQQHRQVPVSMSQQQMSAVSSRPPDIPMTSSISMNSSLETVTTAMARPPICSPVTTSAPPPPYTHVTPSSIASSLTPPPPTPVPSNRDRLPVSQPSEPIGLPVSVQSSTSSDQQSPVVTDPHNSMSTTGRDGTTVSSMAVMLPQGHKGPAVEVNIKPDSRSTTLISVYQYPGAHHMPPHATGPMMAQCTTDGQQQIPPEPVPPAPGRPVRMNSPPLPAPMPNPMISSPKAPMAPIPMISPPQAPLPTPMINPPIRFVPPPPQPPSSFGFNLTEMPPIGLPVPLPAVVDSIDSAFVSKVSPIPLNSSLPVVSPISNVSGPLQALEQSADSIGLEITPEVGEKPKPKRKRAPRKKKEPVEKTETGNNETAQSSPIPSPKKTKKRNVKVEEREEISETSKVIQDENEPQQIITEEVKEEEAEKVGPVTNKAKETKPKRSRYATKKPTAKSRKRKRHSFESDESGEETSSAQHNLSIEAEGPRDSPVMGDEEIAEKFLEKRRSSRVTKRKRYNEDNWDLELGDDGHDKATQEVIEQPIKEEDTMIVEKILLVRTKNTGEKETEQKVTEEEKEKKENLEIDEFLVKYKNYSYLHCEWKTQNELERGDRRVAQKLRRFKQKREQATTFLDEQYDEDEPFNPDYIQVERVLDISTSHELVVDTNIIEEKKIEITEEVDVKEDEKPDEIKNEQEKMEVTTDEIKEEKKENEEKIEEEITEKEKTSTRDELVTHYLIKWRSLQYEDCTWELEKNVDSDKIDMFYGRRVPNEARLRCKTRPSSLQWRKIDQNLVFKGGNILRDYQMEGLNWLLFCWYNKRNCILADEMGLGKTIQTIILLVEIQQYGIYGPFLVVAPLSTIHNWQREFETWSDINAVVYHGTSVSRQMIQEYEMYYRDDKGNRMTNVYKFEVLITTYEMVMTDCEELKAIPWRIIIIDEAHRLKNRNCKLLTGLSTFDFEHRILLTGTPLQNNVDELFSLLNFLEPQQFSNSEMFLAEFGSCQTDNQVNQLQDILKPMMLRRLKEDVEKALKPKEETIVEVELTNIQKKYYRAILERNFSYLSKGASAPSLMNTMMELRKCCNHPFLITGAEEQILIEFRYNHPSVTDLDDQTHQALVQSSGKLVLIDKLLPRLRQDGHKVLVFSQMVRCLDLIEEYLMYMKYPFERIDGNVRGDLRQAAIDRFSKPDSDRFVFLLCTRAGGLGINLTAADTVIIFDSDWNPQNDLQAQARCHRIGQEKFVKVYRLITRNTYEREMFDKASRKLGLDKAVLQSMGTKENMAAQLSKKEVEELLKKGAYAAVMNEENEGDKFSEEDIDTILQRRTKTITVQAGVKGSTFAKASFNMSSNREDIDVNDPNFWQKWAKKANVDTEFNPEAALILYEPRQRKRRFNDEVYRMSEESESETDDDSTRSGRRRLKRRQGEDTNYIPDELAFTKTDYFKVEKFMGIFGWGRWSKILGSCELKQDLTVADIEHMCRTVLLHCVRQFTGDEKIRQFIWEMITPPVEHLADPSVLAADTEKGSPKRRKSQSASKGGRKSSRIATAKDDEEDEVMSIFHQGWAALPAYNPPSLAVDYSYQRHLQRHANKVLLRVRLLHFLEHEVISGLVENIKSGMSADKINLPSPWHPELPVDWWDSDADKSLLIGIYKHGYENFTAIRDDDHLCFRERCGPSEVVLESNGDADNVDTNLDKESAEEDKVDVPEKKDNDEKSTESKMAGDTQKELLVFPSAAELNARFRRLMTLCQRTSRMSQAREGQKSKRSQRQEHIQSLLQDREFRRLEERQRWSRREETDFYRTLISFGVEQDEDTAEYRWERFKQLAKLDTKFDQTLTDYYTAFIAMCKRIAHRPLTKAEESLSWIPESLSEERANKVLQRVEFLNRVRATLRHPKLNSRILICKRTPDLPAWWEPGPTHDLDLIKGISKHGLSKSDEHVVHDPELCFSQLWHEFQKESLHNIDRTTTRSVARLAATSEDGTDSKQKDSDTKTADIVEQIVQSASQQKTELATATNFDPDMTISQILARQSGNFFQWPKERMIIFRVQNICFSIEHGEWPSALGVRSALPTDMDQRSSTPDDTPRDTPGLFGAEDSRDSPQLAMLFKDMRSATPKSRRTRKGRGSSSLASQSGLSGNPLQDLMEAEKERMRALMHQTFLQQLEHLPFAAAAMGFPFMPSISGVQTSVGMHMSQSSPALSTANTTATDEVLNLSTKSKKSDANSSKKSKNEGADTPKTIADPMLAMATMEADTRVPVLNLKDGSRLTGKDAPTLRNLIPWMSEHPNYIVDMPTQEALGVAAASSGTGDTELEPGEVIRPTTTDQSKQSSAPAKTPSSSGGESSGEKVTVINRKNSLKLSGVKAPQLKNLSLWLEKNPDWDVDSSSAQLVKNKAKLPEKLKSRIKTESSGCKSSASAKAATPPSFAGASLDPFGGLFPPGLDPATQLQMQMMLQSPFGNPALLGMGGFGFSSALPMPGMLPSVSTPSLTSPMVQSTYSSSEKKDSEKSTKLKESSSKKSSSEKKDTTATAVLTSAYDNPFLAAITATSSASSSQNAGIFGLHPFMAAGMIPGLNPNLAAMAQLQSLMGMQGLEALMAQQGLAASSLSGLTATTWAPSTSSSSSKKSRTASNSTPTMVSSQSKEKQSTKTTSSHKAKTKTSSATSVKSGRKLNALVDKLAAQKSDTNSPAPSADTDSKEANPSE